jgi:hypothetical protein
MNCTLRSRTWCASPAVLALVLSFAATSLAQTGQPEQTATPSAAQGGYRKLAPGVLKTVDPHLDEGETVSRHDIVELLAADESLDLPKDVAFRREIWFLEFEFKPVRMILVDVPRPNGVMKETLIWYMVYKVTNPGKVLPSVKGPDGTYQLQDSDKPILFLPEFRLRSLESNKIYPDRVIPIAVGPIQMREDPRRKFYTTVEMEREIKVGETLWGVVTWEGIDPKIDRFSVYVNGLTNAYRWQDAPKGSPGAYQPGDPIAKGRKWVRKTLRLNFWRPGDEYYEHEKEIRFGIPGEVDYLWVYR